MEIKPIKTEQDYLHSIKRIEKLWGSKKDTSQGDENKKYHYTPGTHAKTATKSCGRSKKIIICLLPAYSGVLSRLNGYSKGSLYPG